MQHLALSTTQADFDAAKMRLEAAGIEFIGPDRGIDNSIYLRDPNGVNIEFYVRSWAFSKVTSSSEPPGRPVRPSPRGAVVSSARPESVTGWCT